MGPGPSPGAGCPPESGAGPGAAPAPGTGPAPGPAPLLVVCALTIERLALGLRPAPATAPCTGPVPVLRTGMGPRAAHRAVARALRAETGPVAAVAAAGFCAGLVPGMRPGDLVIAEETRDAAGRLRCTGVARLAEALSVPGRPDTLRTGAAARRRRLYIGLLAGSDHVVRSAERAVLRRTGAIAVDMESAVTLRTALGIGQRPVAAVRVVVDAPGYELVRLGTLSGGISAFRTLCAVSPALYEWRRSQPSPRR